MRLSDTSVDVIEAVAAREGVSPTELPEPLYESIDPDALDALFQVGTGRVLFEYLSYEVTVTSDGDVELASREEVRTADR
jgi:hypothetical protein